MKKITLALVGLACLMPMPSIAHARYASGMNLYEYVRSAPPTYVDWDGRRPALLDGTVVNADGTRSPMDPHQPLDGDVRRRMERENSWREQEFAAEREEAARAAAEAYDRANAWTVGTGVGLTRMIHGETAVNIHGTKFYITGTPQAGMRIPASGSTSVLFVYKSGQPHKLYRLDFDVLKIGPRAGQLGWEHNQKGVARILQLDVANHQPAGFAARNAGRAIKVLKWGGRAMIVMGAVQSGIEVYHAEDKARAVVTELSGWAAASGGAYLGGKGGAAAGAWVGSFFGPGPGTAIGAGVGGFIGSVGGGIGGYWAGKTTSETVYDWVVTPPQEEEWIICGEGGS